MSDTKFVDYVGFTFNGVHSSELGIVRVSDGSRFNENLLPTIQDKTVQVPGGDGMHFFGSYYTQKQFNVPYAFDAMTEEQLNRLKVLLGDKKPHDLIFDEAPYKVYYAKVSGTASITHIPFEEGATNRVYKGEGSIQFTAYNPFARSVKKYLNEYTESNKAEWKDAAGLLSTQGVFDKINGNKIPIYNPGAKETDFVLTLNFNSTDYIPSGSITVDSDSLSFNQIIRQGEDDQVKIDTKLNLIEGYKNGKKTGHIYNQYITSGTFFKIPVSRVSSGNGIKQLVLHSNIASRFGGLDYYYIYL